MLRSIYWKAPQEVEEWFRVFLTHIPGDTGEFCRKMYYKKRFNKSGPELHIATHVTIYHPENIETGDWVQFSRFCFINASGGFSIGTNSGLAPFVKIFTANHNFSDPDEYIRFQGATLGPVVIEDDVWIASGAIILPGVSIGKGSVIGAGSVVTRDVPPYSIAAGNPARIIRSRQEEESVNHEINCLK